MDELVGKPWVNIGSHHWSFISGEGGNSSEHSNRSWCLLSGTLTVMSLAQIKLGPDQLEQISVYQTSSFSYISQHDFVYF